MEKILVVDDNPEDRQLAGQCLIEHGMKPVFACNGREAVEVIEHDPPDAVLTDLNMPEMNGLELVRFLRSNFVGLPVVLMTSRGTEQSAISALRAGALSFVPKSNLRGVLCDAMSMVMAAVEERRYRDRTRSLLHRSEAVFYLGYEPDGPSALLSHLEGNLRQINFCDDTELFQIGTALAEAISNAIDHGNLELDSKLREQGVGMYSDLRSQRSAQSPWRERRVKVTERLTTDIAQYHVLDEGKGFDVTEVPDPLQPDALLKVSGRGLLLVRTFMDGVSFNQAGNEIIMTRYRRNPGA